MKRTIIFVLTALVAIAVFAALVHTVLLAAHVSEPAATTVQGLTNRRLWASMGAMLALVSVVTGGLALVRSAKRNAVARGRFGAIVAAVAGLIAVIDGALLLAIASGGPGSGNGVVGAAGALVLGLIGMVVAGLALVRSRQHEPKQT